MSDELENAKTRLAHGRLLLEQHKTRYVDPAVQSRKLVKEMHLAISGMEKYLATLRKSPRP